MAPIIFRQNEHIIFNRGQTIPISKQYLVYKNPDAHVEVFRAEIPASSHAFPNKDNQATVAIKRFTPPNRRLADYIARGFNLERENMLEITRLSHDRFVPLLASFEDERYEYGQFNLVVPFANGGNLDDFLHAKGLPVWLLDSKQLEHWCWDRTRKCLVHCTDNRDRSWCTPSTHQSYFNSWWNGNDADETETIQTLRSRVFLEVTDLLDALTYLHECSEERQIFTIHRDIKPSNILIIDGRFKFADFGLSRIKSSEDTSKTEWLGGTTMYAPPERLDLYDLGRSRDVWAFGCVVLELLVLLYVEWSTSAPIPILPRRSRRGLNAVGAFREQREDCEGSHHSASFANNMSCVNHYIDSLWSFSWTDMVSDTKSHIINSMLITVRAMLVEEPQHRGTAASISRSIQFPIHFARRRYPPSSPLRDALSNDHRPSPPPDAPNNTKNSLERDVPTVKRAPKPLNILRNLSTYYRAFWKYLKKSLIYVLFFMKVQDGSRSARESKIWIRNRSLVFWIILGALYDKYSDPVNSSTQVWTFLLTPILIDNVLALLENALGVNKSRVRGALYLFIIVAAGFYCLYLQVEVFGESPVLRSLSAWCTLAFFATPFNTLARWLIGMFR